MTTDAEFDDIVRLAVYRQFVDDGRPPTPVELAAHLGAPPTEVEASYRRLHDGHVIVLAPGSPYIWMANPLSALPTPFSATVGDRSWFAPCVWDGLGVIAMLGHDGTLDTRCPDCAEPLRIEISEGRVAAGPGLVHYSLPARRWWDDIGYT